METKTTIIPPEALERQAALCGEIQEYWQAQGVTPVAFVDTYGCQQNEADSERIRGMLSAVPIRDEADFVRRVKSGAMKPFRCEAGGFDKPVLLGIQQPL